MCADDFRVTLHLQEFTSKCFDTLKRGLSLKLLLIRKASFDEKVQMSFLCMFNWLFCRVDVQLGATEDHDLEDICLLSVWHTCPSFLF